MTSSKGLYAITRISLTEVPRPANILLSTSSVPVLVDFGFAKQYDPQASDAFHSNLSYGTPEVRIDYDYLLLTLTTMHYSTYHLSALPDIFTILANRISGRLV